LRRFGPALEERDFRLWRLALLGMGVGLQMISLLALVCGGFVDLYSMNIRSTTVALASPDRLRGRVNAVEMVFISASNQLGAFESGLAAFLVGTVPAVVGGGIMTMLIAVSWARFFPALAEVDRLEDVRPPEAIRLAAPA
jgi:hypothetical protein